MGMYVDSFMAGIGGQGILLMGQLLARAAASQGLQTTWLPVYGVEKRGGDTTCTVIISDEEIYSPVVAHPQTMILMHSRMVPRFLPQLREGGLLVTNSTLISREEITREDVDLVEVPAGELAQDLGSEKVANLILLGVFLRKTEVLPLEVVQGELRRSSPKGKGKQLELNLRALELGYSL
ncbi:MAG: 2-oxoacid:ferredoxin oxidoreductase subunit gamma [Aquificota bacterium]|nr:MAG: 2-oxoacid:ferredoxin oxidoreductase subunit gamma [Aquificota bacterium]